MTILVKQITLYFKSVYFMKYIKTKSMALHSNELYNLQQKRLNPEQFGAVQHTEGPVMIIAGPGSGKTRVITERIAHLLNKGTSPENILALTFTNKAAKEMKTRINDLTQNNHSFAIWMGTFHSIFSRILREQATTIGYSINFTIYDNDDSIKIIRRITKDLKLDKDIYNPKHIFSRISLMKNNIIDPGKYSKNDELKNQDYIKKRPQFLNIYRKYCEICKESNCMDFDDLLLQTYGLFRINKDILQIYQMRFQYILIDEYQDTNKVQDEIIKQISTTKNNVCIVGDDSQSIYSFRGADINNMLNFKKNYTDVKEFKLEQNYRSTQNIVNAANSLIAYNKHKIDKTIFSNNEEGEKIKLFEYNNDREEGEEIASMIHNSIMNNTEKSDHAILYRTNSQSKVIEDGLRRRGINYRIFGGLSFYQRKEIKDVMAFLKLILNNNDNESLLRIINYPTRGIGATTINKIREKSQQENKSIWKIINSDLLDEVNLTKGAKNNILNFTIILKELLESINKNIFEIVEIVMEKTGIVRRLEDDNTPENINRLENISELFNSTKIFSMRTSNNKLIDFINEISLDEERDSTPQDTNYVSLMTIHQSKGLEFSYVYILGLENGLFPSQQSMREKKLIEEERRLFYVAITRAIKKVTLSYAINRFKFGVINKTVKSFFLEEINYFFIREFKKNYTNTQNSSEFKIPRLNNRKLIKIKKDDRNTKYIQNLNVGQNIIHNIFGKGEIKKIDNTDGNQKITVLFIENGEKILLTKFAKFEIIT